jgi:hypothetical protein
MRLYLCLQGSWWRWLGRALLTVERELQYLDSKEEREEEPRFQRFRDKQSNLESNFGKCSFVHARILVSDIINLLRNRWR